MVTVVVETIVIVPGNYSRLKQSPFSATTVAIPVITNCRHFGQLYLAKMVASVDEALSGKYAAHSIRLEFES